MGDKSITIVDHTDEVKTEMEKVILRALTAIGLEAENDVKKK